MNGSISLESEVGKGSTFTVHLPQKVAGPNVLGREMAVNLQKFRISTSHIKRMQVVREPMPYGSVLVVDDVESNLYVARHLLTPYDLNIDTALSGFEAIEKIESGKVYDIVFMDHMMPKMDGIETVKKIREMGYKGTIVALTANAIIGQADIFLQNGFDGFISKPINTMQLNAELNRFIRDKQPPEVLAEARKHKGEEAKSEEPPQRTDTVLYEIFARDAKKALPILEATLKNIDTASEDELHTFVIKAHAMKSALANIGESVLSQSAFVLERAGKDGNRDVIKKQTQEFIDLLKEVVASTEPKKQTESTDKAENLAHLKEHLKTVIEACKNYDSKTADKAISTLKTLSWTSETEEKITKISEHILHSDFEMAQAAAEKLCFT
jgi:CheY-like chemotaxis protein